jgi:hypothetical protein
MKDFLRFLLNTLLELRYSLRLFIQLRLKCLHLIVLVDDLVLHSQTCILIDLLLNLELIFEVLNFVEIIGSIRSQ